MNPLEPYLQSLHDIYSSGAGVPETSGYGWLANLFNEVGKSIKPRVRCIINLKNKGAGIPDGGFYTPIERGAPNYQAVKNATYSWPV